MTDKMDRCDEHLDYAGALARSLREMLELREATQNGRVTERHELDIVRDARAALSAAPVAAQESAVVGDAMVERVLSTVVRSLGGRTVEEYIADGGRRFWSPSGWHDNVRYVVRAALEAALTPAATPVANLNAWRDGQLGPQDGRKGEDRG